MFRNRRHFQRPRVTADDPGAEMSSQGQQMPRGTASYHSFISATCHFDDVDSPAPGAERASRHSVSNEPSGDSSDASTKDYTLASNSRNTANALRCTKKLINLSFSETMDDNGSHAIDMSDTEMDIRIRKSRQSKHFQKRGIKMRQASRTTTESEFYTARSFPEEEFVLDSSGQETLVDSATTTDIDAAPQRDAFSVKCHLDARLKHLQNNIETRKSNVEECRRLLEYNSMNLSRIEASLSNIKLMSMPFYELKENIAVLGGFYSAKAQHVKKTLDTCYNNRIEIADWKYRTNRWYLCDILSLDNHYANYSVGKLDDVNAQGEYIHREMQSTLERRSQCIRDMLNNKRKRNNVIKSSFSEITHLLNNMVSCTCANVSFALVNYWDSNKGNSSNYVKSSTDHTSDLYSLFSLYSVYPELENIQINLMSDVDAPWDDFHKVREMIGAAIGDCQDKLEGFDLNSGLCCVYTLYIRLELIGWDPLGAGDVLQKRRLSNFHWYKYLANDWRDILDRIVQDVLLRVVTCAIDAWNIVSTVETLGLYWLIEDTLALDKKLKDIISVHTLKVLQQRLEYFSVEMPNDDVPMSSRTKFHYLKHHVITACNVLQLHNVISTLNMTNVVLDTLFVKYILPAIDVKSVLDALIMLTLFQRLCKTSSQCLYMDSDAAVLFKNTLSNMTLETWDESRIDEFTIDSSDISSIFPRPTLHEYKQAIEKIQNG